MPRVMTELIRIKRAVLSGNYGFAEKARLELRADDLFESDAIESIANAVAIHKRIRSTSPLRTNPREYLYIIVSPTLTGIPLYTKGKLVVQGGVETYYFFVSAKVAQ